MQEYNGLIIYFSMNLPPKALDREEMNTFLIQIPHSSFLQSYEWALFQLALGNRVFPMGAELDDRQLVSMMMYKDSMSGVINYLYCPRGPIVLHWDAQPSELWNGLHIKSLETMAEVGKEQRVGFVRFEPSFFANTPVPLWFARDVNTIRIKEVMPVQPPVTRVLDLMQSEENMQKQMHAKTRYNIGLAEKKGVEISSPIVIDARDVQSFLALIHKTSKRQGITPHPASYYELMAKKLSVAEIPTLGNPGMCYARLFIARYQGKVVAINMIIFFGDTATYVHGASDYEYRELMAPYLLQWEAMREAKRLGYGYYDLWGVQPETQTGISANIQIKTAAWAGISRFKAGFGGTVYYYPGTYDLILDAKKYIVYEVLAKIRRFIH